MAGEEKAKAEEAVPGKDEEPEETLDGADGGKEEPEEKDEETHKIASRGIPSKDSLFLPPFNSPELRAFQDGNENITRNSWNLEEVVNFVFPARFQAKYHEIAIGFMRLLLEKSALTGDEIGNFVS
ncbi:MAG: hypothetical protein WC263_04195, partial [Candidatus Micrarchaeia archaeon]